ncbi:MAG: ATP-binding protein [Gemmatimonadales bacterium]
MVSEPLVLAERSAPEGGPAVELRIDVPSDLSSIEQAVELVSARCEALGMQQHAARFNLRVALTEALANAIIFGNGVGSATPVTVVALLRESALRVEVVDVGGGFDPDQVPDPTAPDRIELPDGRGLFLIRHLVDEVSFSKRGNAICMVLRPT